MKQTKNALTFLNSSYQAVYKHAYFVGVASSFAVMAASPYAMAGTHDHIFGSSSNDLKNPVINNYGKAILNTSGSLYAETVTVNGSGSSTSYLFVGNKSNTKVYFTDEVLINNATLLVSGSETHDARLVGGRISSALSDKYVKGTLTITNGGLDIINGKVEVNTTNITSTTIDIGGMAGNGTAKTHGIYLNYSALRTGQFGENDLSQAGDTNLTNIDMNMNEYSVLDSMGEVSFNSGYINIQAPKDTTGAQKELGEIAAKAIIRAETFNIESPNSNSRFTVVQNAGGAIFANETNIGKGGIIDVRANGELQIAGQINLTTTNEKPASEGQAANAAGTANCHGANFEDAVFNITSGSISNVNGSTNVAINNSGSITFGANSYARTGLIPTTFTASKLDINHTGGRVHNYGTIYLGDGQISENATVDTSNGATTYTLDKNGIIDNTGSIIVNQGSKLDLNDGIFANTGNIDLKSGSYFSVAAGAVSGKTSPKSITRGENIDKVELYRIGDVNAESGSTIELKNGVFTAEGGFRASRLGKQVADNLEAGQNLDGVNWIVNDATLQLDTNLDLSTDKIANAGFSGSSTLDKAIIATKGNLNFTTQSGTDIGDLAGFDKIQGANVVINEAPATTETFILSNIDIQPYWVDVDTGTGGGTSGSGETIESGDTIEQPDLNIGTLPDAPSFAANTLWITNSNPDTKTISATESLNTGINSAPLGIGENVVVELTAHEFETEPDSGAAVRHVDVDVEIGTGGTLLVSAAPWGAHTITSDSGSALKVIAGGKNESMATDYATHAELIANKLDLNGQVYVDQGASLSSKGDIVLREGSVTTINDGSRLLTEATLYVAGNLTFDASYGVATTTTAGSGGSLIAVNHSTLNLGTTNVAEGASMLIETGSNVSVDRLLTAGNNTGTTQVDINAGTLNIKGDNNSSTSDISVDMKLSNGSTLNIGNAFDTIGLQFNTDESSFTLNDDFKKLTAYGSTLKLDLSNLSKGNLTSAEIDKLKESLLTSESTGAYLSLTGAGIADLVITDNNGNKFIDFSSKSSGGSLELDYDADNTRDAILTNVTAGANIAGGFKAIQISGSSTEGINVRDDKQLNIYGTTSSGNLIENDSGTAVGAILSANAQLNLKSSGKIGDVTGEGIVNIGADTDKVAVEAANITAAKLNTTDATLSAKTITAGTTTLANSQLTAENFIATGEITASNSSTIKVNDTLTLQQGMQINNGTAVSAKNILVTSGDLAVGTESGENTAGSTGTLVAQNLDLNGNSLILDPEFGQKTATAFIQSFADLDTSSAESTATDIMKINGNIIVGRNSALGLGGEEADFKTELAKLQDKNGSLKQDGIGALMFANQTQIALNGNKIIVGTEDVEELKKLASGSDTIYLGQNAGLQVGVKALSKAIKDDELIFSDLGATDTIKANGGTLIVPVGTESKEIAAIFGTEVQLADGTSLKVQTDNGAYTGVIESNDDLHGNGDFKLEENENTRNILGNMSDPTYEYYQNVLENGQANNTLDFIKAVGSQGDGSALEQAGRLGAFGAGAQIALQTSQAATDAIMQRVGATSNVSNADQSVIENGTSALWINPIYKKSSSENLAADNLGYGSDVDLYGVAAGFDHNVNNSFKFGAMFNAGKGDASGSGVAAGVNNEFTYYGGGIYASVQPTENFALSADVSYTAVNNDLKANTGLNDFGDLTGEADSTALSAGINAQYAIQAGNVQITPHAGVRYTKLDLDKYDVKVDNEQLAQTTTETASVVSVPVGIRFSADINNGNWNIKPSADFTVTSNFGDKTLKSTTTFAGQDGAINYNTDFIDSTTYGAKADLQIQNGNFSIGAGVGYTKSSNTDELSVGANIRLDF